MYCPIENSLYSQGQFSQVTEHAEKLRSRGITRKAVQYKLSTKTGRVTSTV